MGLYAINCPACGKSHVWFSGSMDQRCEACKKPKEWWICWNAPGSVGEAYQCEQLSEPIAPYEQINVIEKSAFDFQCKQVKDMAETFNKSCSYYQEQIRELQTQVNIEKAEVSRLLAMTKRRNKTR